MRLNKLRIIGFQSFSDSGELEFLEGINLIIGQNNAGKSALLRAMQGISDDRHRTPEVRDNVRLPVPEAELNVTVSGEDLRLFHLMRPGNFIAVPPGQNYQEFCGRMFGQAELRLSIVSTPGQWTGPYPTHGLFDAPAPADRVQVQFHTANGVLSYLPGHGVNDSTSAATQYTWQQKMFYFSAERLAIGESGHMHANRLQPNASNIPAVLLRLNGDRGNIFDRLVEHLRQIFSTVGNISVRPKPENGNIEVRVWPTEDREHVDLSFPLTNSGTGVAQVIAILTAVMTTENSVIIIDEINSFLHPAAVKALLRIIQTEYGGH